jgi:acyl-CoA thioesterase
VTEAPGPPIEDAPTAGGDLLATLRERTHANLFWRHIGVEALEAGPGWVRLRVPVRDELRNAAQAPVHGGVLATLVDAAVGGALATLHAAAAGGVGQTTLDLNVSFLAAATGPDLLAEGRILRRGRSVAFGEVRITDSSGRLVAVGRATYMILPAGTKPGEEQRT